MMQCETKKYYAGPIQGDTLSRGTELSSEPLADSIPLILKSHEFGSIKGKTYLLVDKTVDTFLGSAPSREHGNVYFFKSENGCIIVSDIQGKILEIAGSWLQKGAKTNEGLVIECGDQVALVDNGIGRKVFRKSQLRPANDYQREIQVIGESADFFIELRKRLEPDTQQSTIPRVKIGFNAGKFKLNLNPEAQPAEGTMKQFGPNDTRKLMRTPDGAMRWMNADEEKKELERRQQKKTESVQNEGTPKSANQFRIGQEIPYKGEKVQIVSYADNIVAFKKEDGSTGTLKATDYDREAENKSIAKKQAAVPLREAVDKKHGKMTEIYQQNALDEKHQRQQERALEFEPHPESVGEKYQEEVNRIHNEQILTPEYKEFKEKLSAGWNQLDDFNFQKEVEWEQEGWFKIHFTMNRTWMPEKKSYLVSVNDRPIHLTYKGEARELVDIDGDDIVLKTGNDEVKINQYDLDKYKGTLILDEDGNATVQKGEKELGALSMEEGITQADLLKPGTIRIINDEVWKRVEPAVGTRYTDVRLGKIATGITVYKHGDEVGVVDGNRRTNIVLKKDTRRSIDDDKLDDGSKKVKRLVIGLTGRLKEEQIKNMDFDTAKARIEGGKEKIGSKSIDAGMYKDVFDSFVNDGGEGIEGQIAEAYGRPEWKATIQSLAERMKVADDQRGREIDAFNALSKSGILKEKPAARQTSDYLDTAESFIRQYRNDYLRDKLREKIGESRTSGAHGKFEWGETSEVPENAKAVVEEPFKIRDSSGNSYHVVYAFVPMDTVVESHNVEGQENAEHPVELQARKRSNVHAVTQMQKIASDINDDVVTDNADATRGAPVAFARDGKVYIIQGNGRSAGIKGTEGTQREKYFGMILDKAKNLGIPTDNITENDMLVRILTPMHTYEDARRLAAFGQKSAALPQTEVEEARAFQNAQRMPYSHKINLEGIGNRPIDEQNVGTFIRNNPQLYQEILKDSGLVREAVESHPSVQARLVNIAMLAQLKSDFIEDIASRDDKTHRLVRQLAPVLADNQRAVAEGQVPIYADIQSFLGRVVKSYDNLGAGTKSLMNIRAGNIEFLNDDPQAMNPDTLIHRMRQEDLLSTEKKEENLFRDPLTVVGLIAYHQAMNPRIKEENRNKLINQFALKVRRFSDALKMLGQNQDNIFGSLKSEEQKKAEQYRDVVAIAERTLLENKPYRSGEEQLTADEQEISKEQYGTFDVYRKMENIARKYSFELANEKGGLKKSIRQLTRFFRSDRDKKAIVMFRKSVEKPTEGEIRMFGPNDRRRFSADQGRWLNDDDYEKQKKEHQSQKKELQSHKLEQWQKDIKVGDEVKYRGLRVKVTDIADHILAVKTRLGKHFAISRTSVSEILKQRKHEDDKKEIQVIQESKKTADVEYTIQPELKRWLITTNNIQDDGSVVLYHGTSSKKVSQIRKMGLSNTEKNINSGDVGNIYLSRDKGDAQSWANVTAEQDKGNPEVIEIRVPKEYANKLQQDRNTGLGVTISSSIPKEWIKERLSLDKEVIKSIFSFTGFKKSQKELFSNTPPAELTAMVEEAAKQTDTQPTEEQKHSGIIKKVIYEILKR